MPPQLPGSKNRVNSIHNYSPKLQKNTRLQTKRQFTTNKKHLSTNHKASQLKCEPVLLHVVLELNVHAIRRL